MNFLHSEVNVQSDEAVIVELDHAANVKVMDAANFQRFRRGESHRYFGGAATRSPVAIRPPHGGRWFVTIDLGGGSGRVRASVRVQ
jgi:hypothetical protein